MRIPAEVIPLVGNVGKDLSAERKAEPVGAYGGLDKELPPAPRGESPSGEGHPRRQPPGPVAPPPGPPSSGERRQAERRVQQRPVLLDTRSKQSRRRGPGASGIDIKV